MERNFIQTDLSLEELMKFINQSVEKGLCSKNILSDDTIVDRNFLRDNFNLSRRQIQHLELSTHLHVKREDNRHKYRLSDVLKALNLK